MADKRSEFVSLRRSAVDANQRQLLGDLGQDHIRYSSSIELFEQVVNPAPKLFDCA